MELCSDGHQEVVFVGSAWDKCPACVYAQEVRDEMQSQIDNLNNEIETHECDAPIGYNPDDV